ncbi:MAG: hypothetical protein LBP95_13500 [Deltaproteobacteria bacterium]|jgi:type IV pilus assembly protein PilY1|nr:hypothetical protein [Deltaproteobacteria bacterium]
MTTSPTSRAPGGRLAAGPAPRLAALLLCLAFLAAPAGLRAQVAEPDKSLYESQPFNTGGQVVPKIMLVLSKDLKMFQAGYPGLVDFDGDGRVDTGFNPRVRYVGYFDSDSCYAYSGRVRVARNGVLMTGDPAGYFHRTGPSVADQTQDEINASRPGSLKAYVVSPRSAAGVCNSPSAAVGGTEPLAGRTFSGNWLNFVTTSRMDAIRKILYGGYRSVDTADRTMLEGSFVPPDSTVWGSEVRSDDTWMEVTPLSAWYDVSKYTPYPKPSSGRAHFFARGSDLGAANKFFPAMRVLLNVDRSSFDLQGKDSVDQPVSVTLPHARYWDWVLVNRPLPDDKVLTAATRDKVLVYKDSVLACNPVQGGREAGCQRYPGPTDSENDDVYKPVGLLQRYGSGSKAMYFGLITGGNNLFSSKQGGKLRNHIGPVEGDTAVSANVYVPPVNSRTGRINQYGLIKNIDNLRISGRQTDRDPNTWEGAGYFNTYSSGNPMGEMLYEAVRYLGGAAQGVPAYNEQADADVAGSTIPSLTSFPNTAGGWNARKFELGEINCVKPVVLLISDITSDHDGDSFGSVVPRELLSSLKFPAGITEANDLPKNFDFKTYLKTVSRLEGLDARSGEYPYSRNATDSCEPKTLNSLADVSGLCPTSPSGEGTYSVVAAAYYAHIRNFNLFDGPGASQAGVDLYSVTMSSTFPELRFSVRNPGGAVQKSVDIFPASLISNPNDKKILSFLNYFVIDWDTDKSGQPFHVRIKVNFSDRAMDNNNQHDWEGDAQVTYDINLLTDSATPSAKRETTPLASGFSGDSAVRSRTYYKFKNPAAAETMADFIELVPGEVKAVSIASSWEVAGTADGIAMGYTIGGTTRDGTYMDLTMNTPKESAYLTPPTCPYVGLPPGAPNWCQQINQNLKNQTRVFAVSDNVEAKTLPNPMWLAAKYGGFEDLNRNGVPDPGEWEGADGNPKNYFEASNIAELSEKLELAFRSISNSFNTGTATSASVNSILGGGLSIHSYYYPRYVNPQDPNQLVDWVGGVYGLFMDRYGNLREDSDGDKTLTLRKTADSAAGDSVISFNVLAAGATPPPCYVDGRRLTRCLDPRGDNNLTPIAGQDGAPDSIHRLDLVFDSSAWLASLDDAKIVRGSRGWSEAATVANGKRRVYFGKPAASGPTMGLFHPKGPDMALLTEMMLPASYASILPGTNNLTRAETTRRVVEYVLGVDQPGWRSRRVANPWNGGSNEITWRHGDVINSKPILVGAPQYNYDLLYGDTSYTKFRSEQAGRRLVLYYGANDGMLHAVNLGFLGSLKSGQVSYLTQLKPEQTAHELGAELWSYVPTSLLPHLQWMADPAYTHAYYVDMMPLMSDVKIDGEWRTILIAGLRLGGRPIEAGRPGANPQGPHYFSEVFALDVTDPEVEPRLMWRYSALELGLSVGLPAVVSSDGQFYAVLASGPVTDNLAARPDGSTEIVFGREDPKDGVSSQRARLIVLDVKTGLEVVPQTENGRPTDYLVAPEADSFFNEPFVPAAQIRATPWTNHAVYYGLTVSRSLQNSRDSGAVYRLQTVGADGRPLGVRNWRLARLFDTGQPVSGQPNSAYDPKGNLWVTFGTGRLWSNADLAPCQSVALDPACEANHLQHLYGLKEPLGPGGLLTFADLTPLKADIIDVSGAEVLTDGVVRNIPATPLLTTNEGGTAMYEALRAAATSAPAIGYKRALEIGRTLLPGLPHKYEMMLTQPKIASIGEGNSLMAFTSFEPTNRNCEGIGRGYQYAVDTYTGLPMPLPSFGDAFMVADDGPAGPGSGPKVITGGVAMSGGRPTETVIISVEGKHIIRGSSGEDASFTDIEIATPESPLYNGLTAWREVLDVGVEIPADVMGADLPESSE